MRHSHPHPPHPSLWQYLLYVSIPTFGTRRRNEIIVGFPPWLLSLNTVIFIYLQHVLRLFGEGWGGEIWGVASCLQVCVCVCVCVHSCVPHYVCRGQRTTWGWVDCLSLSCGSNQVVTLSGKRLWPWAVSAVFRVSFCVAQADVNWAQVTPLPRPSG